MGKESDLTFPPCVVSYTFSQMQCTTHYPLPPVSTQPQKSSFTLLKACKINVSSPGLHIKPYEWTLILNRFALGRWTALCLVALIFSLFLSLSHFFFFYLSLSLPPFLMTYSCYNVRATLICPVFMVPYIQKYGFSERGKALWEHHAQHNGDSSFVTPLASCY